MKKIAINGFGRIGRLAFRLIANEKDMEVVAINDLTSAEELAYYLKYDTFEVDKISFDKDSIIYNDKKIRVYSEKDPSVLPWRELDVDVVLECTGLFTKLEDAYKHVVAGAKHVVISAPGKGNMKTIVYGVNSDTLDGTETVISAASCTTNCLAPVVDIINKEFNTLEDCLDKVFQAASTYATEGVKENIGGPFGAGIIQKINDLINLD